jgi:hypothetical protein
MSSREITTRKQGEELLVRKATDDPSFRQQLLANPAATISSALGVRFADDVRIHVVEEDDKNLYLVLPAANNGQLAEAELAAVVGGIIIVNHLPSSLKAGLRPIQNTSISSSGF